MKLPFADSSAQREGRAIFQLAAPLEARADHLRLMRDMNWSRLLQIAVEEGAVGALRDHLRDVPRGIVPLDVQRRLASLAMQCRLRMRAMERLAETSLSALSAAGIEVVLLDGAALAATAYRSFAARPMTGLDMLVEPGRADEARSILFEAGWVSHRVPPEDGHSITHHHLPPLVDAGGRGLRLTLHRELLPHGHPFLMTPGDAWRDVRRVRVRSSVAYVLQPARHALHLAIRFAWSHAMRAGGWHAFRDLGALQRCGQVDWDELVQFALRTRASSCCYWTLRLAQALAALDVPVGVLDALAPPHGAHVSRFVERHLIATLTRQLSSPVSLRLEHLLWTMAIEPQRLEHGGSRPWLVASERAGAGRSGESMKDDGLRSEIAEFGGSSVHLGSLARA